DNMLRILNGMVRVLTTLEKFTKPRSMFLFSTPVMKYVNSLIIIICAFLLMLPLPVPLTDFLPAYGILFLAVGSLERDGYLIFAGYLLVIVTTIYFSLIAILGLSGMKIILAHLGLPY
ncbi:MAG: exopolysaccharide biosynthesis protein, partial [Methanobacterium paludis]|nr:exopolysaccharide biosynthesis protein [Methanobacterium paludis]